MYQLTFYSSFNVFLCFKSIVFDFTSITTVIVYWAQNTAKTLVLSMPCLYQPLVAKSVQSSVNVYTECIQPKDCFVVVVVFVTFWQHSRLNIQSL